MHSLADTAEKEAKRFFHGYSSGTKSNLEKIIAPFPGWTLQEADGVWCAAFVYYCCQKAGMLFPIRPDECVSCNLAGCPAWEEWAAADDNLLIFKENSDCCPQTGDIVLFDRVFNNSEHDHIGIVLDVQTDHIVTAEGNFNNVSAIVERKRDEHIRCYIRIPEKYKYIGKEKV